MRRGTCVNQINSKKVYAKKPATPVPYSQYKTKTRSHQRKHSARRPSTAQATPESILRSLSSINIMSILNSFYTIRMTVKDLRVSLEKLDSAMDSAYQMVEIAQSLFNNQPSSKGRPPLRLLPPDNRVPKGRDKKSERQQSDNQLSGLLDNVDVGQLMTLMQSPFVQNILKQIFQGDALNSGSSTKKGMTSS